MPITADPQPTLDPFSILLHLPPALGYTLLGLYLGAKVLLAAWVAARAGRSPLWGLTMIIPGMELIAVWIFAITPWPAQLRRAHR